MRQTTLLLALLLTTFTANAEVMDKESSTLSVFLWTALPLVPAYLAARYRPWLLLLVLPIPLFFFAAQLQEITDPWIGPAILGEAGAGYVALSWSGPVLLVGVILAGFYARFNSRVRA
jgi:hypothetical protein